MTEEKKQRGGKRAGSGRPTTHRKIAVTVRISHEASDKLKRQKNMSEYIDNLIIKQSE